MQKALLAALAVSGLAFGAPSASAAHFERVGGCGFVPLTDAVAGQSQMTGAIDVEAVVYSTTTGSNPVTATFTCHITVNGVPAPGASVTASGTAGVVGAGLVAFTGHFYDDIELCETVTYTSADASSETVSGCFPAPTFEIPPPIVWELVDPPCYVFIALAPGIDALVINSEGDIWLAGEPLFDCPPYNMDWDG